MRSAERGRAGGGVAHLRSAERVCGDSSPMRPPLRSVRMGFLKNSASPMRRRLGVAMWGSVRQRVGDSERLGVGDSERLGVGESVGHGDVRVRESARRERVGESRRRVGNALFSVTPLTRSVSGECVGVWRMSMPMRFGDALLRERGGRSAGRTRLQLTPDSASGDRVEREICTARRCRCRCIAGVRQRRRVRGACAPDAVEG